MCRRVISALQVVRNPFDGRRPAVRGQADEGAEYEIVSDGATPPPDRLMSGACTYELDGEFRIRAVDAAWSAFALANGAPELVVPPGPIGRSIFGYLQDATTADLCRRLFERVRQSGRSVVFPFRCDSPGLRRFLEMTINSQEPAGLHLETRVVRLEARAPVALLERAARRSAQLLVMCSWCKAVEVAGEWRELEDAVVALRLFEREALPMLTHGICAPCRERLEGELE